MHGKRCGLFLLLYTVPKKTTLMLDDTALMYATNCDNFWLNCCQESQLLKRYFIFPHHSVIFWVHSVEWSVCVSFGHESDNAKRWNWTWCGLRCEPAGSIKPLLGGGPESHHGKGNFGSHIRACKANIARKGCVCWTCWLAAQKRMNWSRCHLGVDSCGSKAPCTRWGPDPPYGKGQLSINQSVDF